MQCVKRQCALSEKIRPDMRATIFKNRVLSLSYVFLVLSLCIPEDAKAQFPVFKASVKNELAFQEIPSASGIVKFQDSYYVIGDDSPYLFQLDSAFRLVKKIEIFGTKHLQNGRLPKKEKPDFECITVVPWGNDEDLLVFGSGDGKERHVLVRIDIDEGRARVESYSLKGFYKYLRKIIHADELNIEGAGFWNNALILLNRRDNALFMVDLDDFKAYVKGKDRDHLKVSTKVLKLPSINGMSARFSGLSVLPDEDIMVFSASVENDPNWIVNDDIVCSYVGIIDLKQLDNDEPICELIKKDDLPIKEKVESLNMISKNDRAMELVGVIDNDDGSSKLIEIAFEKVLE